MYEKKYEILSKVIFYSQSNFKIKNIAKDLNLMVKKLRFIDKKLKLYFFNTNE